MALAFIDGDSLLLIGLQGILVCPAWPGLRTSAWELLHLVDGDLSRVVPACGLVSGSQQVSHEG